MIEQESPSRHFMSQDALIPIAVNEIVDAGRLSHPETLRGRALAVANGTIADEQLIAWFLEERASSQNTRASYEAQLLRLAWFVRDVLKAGSIRLLQREDWKAFEDYLRRPPAAHVMSGASVGRTHPQWRPFRGPLGPSSVTQAQTVVKSFYAWLADSGVAAIDRSPIGGLKTRRVRVAQSAMPVERFLDTGEWQLVEQAIARMPHGEEMEIRAQARAHWVFELLVFSGLRVSEMAAATSSMIRPASGGRWHLDIVRKGNVRSHLPLLPRVIEGWSRYRLAVGLASIGPEDDVPLVSALRAGRMDQPMTRQAIWDIIKSTCAAAAEIARDAGDAHAEAKLQACSPHWIRHTFGTRLSTSGASPKEVQDLMDHASLTTTSKYLHTTQEQRLKALERIAQS